MQLALGAVGAVVGAYFGMPQVGWAVGAAIGGAIEARNQPGVEGPRLSDLSSQISSYGVPIPRIYGTVGTPGNVIWALPLREEATESGGKGGPPEATNYSYFATFALLLGEGRLKLRRIWVQGKCYYDIRDETNIAAITASANFARYFTFYEGTDTQLPDPTMEASLGVGNVPAYLDESYILFHDLPVGQFNNSPIGSLAIVAEVVHDPDPVVTGMRFIAGEMSGVPPMGGAGSTREIYPVTGSVVRIGGETAADGVKVYSLDGSTPIMQDTGSVDERARPNTATDPIDSSYAGGALIGTGIRCDYAGAARTFSNPLQLLYIGTEDANYDLKPFFDPAEIFRGVIPSADMVHFLVGYSPGATESPPNTTDVLLKLFAWDGTAASVVWNGTLQSPYSLPQGNTSVFGSGSFCGMIETDLDYFWLYANNAGTASVFQLDHDTDQYNRVLHETQFTLPELGWGVGLVDAAIYCDNGLAYFSSGEAYFILTRNDGPPANGETLESVVLAECALPGLDSSLVDASELASIIVDGMRIARITTTRSILGALMSAYWFDMREGGGQLESVLRGNASQATISQDDLGAGFENASDELVGVERLDDEALPGQIYVGYISEVTDYQWAAQGDRRSVVEQEQPSPIEVPLVLTDEKAKQICSVLLYSQWIGRTTRKVKVSRKFARVQPADMVTIETDEGEWLVRCVNVKAAAGLISIEGVDDEPALYDPNVEAAVVDRDTSVTSNPPTYFAFLNIPAQRPQDTDAGFYVAATGYSQPWPGARVYESLDGGTTFNSIGFISSPSMMGPVPEALPDQVDISPVDGYDDNVLTVQILYGTPQSTDDAGIIAGRNKAAVGLESGGWEIIQYKTATFISGNTWELSELKRGLQGTEAHIATHVDNEKFVNLDPPDALLRIARDPSTVGSDRIYTAVTIGEQVGDAVTVGFANQGTAATPIQASDVVFDPTGLDVITAENVQDALEQLDAAIDSIEDDIDVIGGETGGVPYFIASGVTITVPTNYQALFNEPIDIEGDLVIDGLLIEVD